MLTAWGLGSVPGPRVMASIRESTGRYSQALYLLAALMLVSAVVPFVVRPPRPQQAARGVTPAAPAAPDKRALRRDRAA